MLLERTEIGRTKSTMTTYIAVMSTIVVQFKDSTSKKLLKDLNLKEEEVEVEVNIPVVIKMITSQKLQISNPSHMVEEGVAVEDKDSVKTSNLNILILETLADLSKRISQEIRDLIKLQEVEAEVADMSLSTRFLRAHKKIRGILNQNKINTKRVRQAKKKLRRPRAETNIKVLMIAMKKL
jgi:hypothetical protein